jgi:hypothetical protein
MTEVRITALMILSIFRPKEVEPLNVGKSGNLGLIFLSMLNYADEIFAEDDFGLPTETKSHQK